MYEIYSSQQGEIFVVDISQEMMKYILVFQQ